ncbi:MAG: protein kinase [Candidatus Aminicenantes bacterium]|nr:protein kinase [Candidatus Aminicenantes bacterium]
MIKCPECQSDNPSDSKYCKECATPLPSSEEPQVSITKTIETPTEELTRGTVFASRYEIIEELGKGGMGRVYRVEDKKIKEEVALKLIKPDVASDKKTIERFSNELKMARKIAHRNVCRMYDLGEEKGTHYITMEYVPGEDLKRLIKKVGQFSAGKTIFMARQVCEGLAEAHRLRVVHRDLKPQNIMVDEDGNARIMDFGIARTVKGKGLTGAGVMVGTPEYMSPEQAEVKEVDQRSDIYSLGVILYEMVTGRVPFEGETPLGIAMKHKSEAPPDPRQINAQLAEDLSRVIMRCLEKDKEKRYQSAGEVRSELLNIEKGMPTTERIVPEKRPITSREITVKFSIRKLFIPAVVVIAVAIIGLIIWRFIPRKQPLPAPSDKPSLAIVYFENNSGDESLDHWRKALCELLIADLTQSKYIRVLSSDKLLDILSSLNQIEAKSFSSKVLKEVAARGGSTHILRGGFTKAGEQYRIDAILQEAATMESVGSDRIEGRGEESFLSMVDELTRKVKAHFELSAEEIAGDIDEEVEKITTSSPEALKYYIEGRKYHGTFDYKRSIELIEKAVDVDPDFAMAYRSLAQSYGNIGFRPKRKEYMQKALELSHRLPAKERYLIGGDFYGISEKTYDKSIEAYKKLLELYPDNYTGNHNIAVRYSAIGEKQKAIEHYETTRKSGNITLLGYGNLASVYRQVGSYDKAREVLEEAIQKYPDKPIAHANLSLHYRMAGKYEIALAEIEKALALEPAKSTELIGRQIINRRALIHFYTDNMVKAAEDYQWLLKQKEPQAIYLGLMGMANLNILQGKFKGSKDMFGPYIDLCKKYGANWPISQCYLRSAYIDLKASNLQEALKDCDNAIDFALKAEDSGRQRRALHLKGLTYVRMNALDEALKTAEGLRVLIQDSHNPNRMHFFHHLVGMVELKKKDFASAIESFKQALSLQTSDPHDKSAGHVESLARAYYASGNIDKAQAEYERIVSSSSGRSSFGDVYARSYYELGKIYEQKGWKGKAIEHYEKFLELWKDADSGFPEVEDAKKRLAALKSQ